MLYFLSHQSRVARTREQTCELSDTPLTVDPNPFMTVNTEEGGGYLLPTTSVSRCCQQGHMYLASPTPLKVQR